MLTQRELELLNRLGYKDNTITNNIQAQEQNQAQDDGLTEQQRQQKKIDSLRASMKESGVDTSFLDKTDSTLGSFTTGLKSGLFADTPAAGWSLLKTAVPTTAGLDPYFTEKIKENQLQAQQYAEELTPEAQESIAFKGGNLVGGAIPVVAPIAARFIPGLGQAIGAATAAAGMFGTQAGLTVGGDTAEFEQRRRAELEAKNAQLAEEQKLTQEQIQQTIDNERQAVAAKSLPLALADAAIGVATGGIGKGAKTVLGAATKAGATDIIPSAVSAGIQESIVGGALESGPDEELRKEKMIMGGIGGALPSAAMAGAEKYIQRGATQKTLQEQEALRQNKLKEQGLVETKISSLPMIEEFANKALDFKVKSNRDATVNYELRDAVDQNGNVLKGRKELFEIKQRREIIEPIQEITPTETQDIFNTQAVLDNNSLAKNATQAEIVDINTIEDKNTILTNDIDVQDGTVYEKRKIERVVKDPETNKGSRKEVEIVVPSDRDNLGFGLTLQQTLNDKENLTQKGKKDIINIEKSTPLSSKDLSDNFMYKPYVEEGDLTRTPNLNMPLIKNKNIKDRMQGKYEFYDRTLVNDGKSMEFISTLAFSDKEPFLTNVRNIKDGQEIYFSKEKSKDFPENIAIYTKALNEKTGQVEDIKVGRLSRKAAKEISKQFENNNISSIKANFYAVEVPYSQKAHSDLTRQSYETTNPETGNVEKMIARTSIVAKVELKNKLNEQDLIPKSKLDTEEDIADAEMFRQQQRTVRSPEIDRAIVNKKEQAETAKLDKQIKKIDTSFAKKEEEINKVMERLLKEEQAGTYGMNAEEKRLYRDQLKSVKSFKNDYDTVSKKAQAEQKKYDAFISRAEKRKLKEITQAEKDAEIVQQRLLGEELSKVAEEERVVREKFLAEEAKLRQQEAVKQQAEQKKVKMAEMEEKDPVVKAKRNIEKLNKKFNNSIEVYIDYKAFEEELTPSQMKNLESLRDTFKVEYNEKPNGFIVDQFTDTPKVFLSADRILERAKKNNIPFEDMLQFVYFHEVLGHGALGKYFKTEAELNKFLDNVLSKATEGSVLKELMNTKKQSYKRETYETEEDWNRALIEEVLSDFANGKIKLQGANGKYIVKDLVTFVNDFANSKTKDAKEKAGIIRKFYNAMKEMFQNLTGSKTFRDIEEFKALNDIIAVNNALRKMQDELINSSYKDKLDATPIVNKKDIKLEVEYKDLNEKEKALRTLRKLKYSSLDSTPSLVKYFVSDFKNDRDFALEAVKATPDSFKYIQKKFKNDREITLEAVKEDGFNLRFTSQELQADKEVVLEAVKKTGLSLGFASKELQADKEVVLTAVKQDGFALKDASEELRKDRDLTLMAVKQNGASFSNILDKFKNDKEIALEAVKEYYYALELIPTELKQKYGDNKEDFIRNIEKAINVENMKKDLESTLTKKEGEIKPTKKVKLDIDWDDKEQVLEEVKEYGSALQFASDRLKDNREVVLEAVKKYGGSLEYASPRLQNDKEVVLEAVKRYGFALAYASDRLKNDKEVVLEAVKENGNNLRLASKELRDNKDLVLKSMELGGNLYYASYELRDDYDVALAAIKSNSADNMEYVGYSLRDDKYFMLEAAKIDPESMYWVSQRLENKYGEKSKEFIRNVEREINAENLKKDLESTLTKKEGEIKPTKKVKLDIDWDDKKQVLEEVKKDGWSLEYASEELQADKEVVLTAVKKNGWSLEHASEELQADKEVVLTAVKQNGMSLEYASDRLKNDKEVVLAAVKENGYGLEYASEELQADKEVVLSAVEINGNNLRYASPKLQNDKEVVLAAIKQDSYSLQYASEELKNNREVVLEAVKQTGWSFKYASEELQNDKEIALEAVKEYFYTLELIPTELKQKYGYGAEDFIRNVELAIKKENTEKFAKDLESTLTKKEGEIKPTKKVKLDIDFDDKEQVLEAVKKYGTSLEYASKKLQNDKEVVLEAVKQDGWDLKYASDRLKNDKEVVLTAIKGGDSWALGYASDRLKNDREVVLTAVKEDGFVLNYISKELKDKYGDNAEDFIRNVEREINSENLKKDLESTLTKKEGEVKPVKRTKLDIEYADDLIVNVDKRVNIGSEALGMFTALSDKMPWFGTMQGKARKDPVFAEGFDLLQRVEESGKAIDLELQTRLKHLFTERFGWKSGIDKKDIPQLDKILYETKLKVSKMKTDDILEKLSKNEEIKFTDEELKDMGYSDKIIHSYNLIYSGLLRSKELKAMSELFKEAYRLGLRDQDSYDKFRNISDFNYEEFKNSLMKEIIDKKVIGQREFIKKATEFDNMYAKMLDFDTVPIGDWYVYVKNNNGQVVDFKQFNSKYQARVYQKRILSANRGKQLSVEIDKTPVSIKDTEDKKIAFNKIAKEYGDYMQSKYESGQTKNIPFEYYRNVFTIIDDTSKNASLNIHLPVLNQYIKGLKEQGNAETGDQLEKLRNYELTPDSKIATKLRNFNSIWNLGGSVAGAVSNFAAVPMIVNPYLQRFDGGNGSMLSLANMTRKGLTDMVSGKLSTNLTKQELAEHINDNYIKSTDKKQSYQDVLRLIESGILFEVGDYDIVKVKDGIDLTGKYQNLKNITVNNFMLPFAKSEALVKLVTLSSALNTAYANNLKGFDFAKKTLYETQGYYGKAGRPAWARSGVGQLAFQFKNFPLNFAELMINFAFNGNKKDRIAALKMASLLILLGGLKSMPGSSDVGDITDTLRRVLGEQDANIGKEIEDSLSLLLGKENTGLLMYGFASEFGLPFNLQQRIAFNNIIPGTNLLDPANKDRGKSLKEIGGPTASNLGNFITAIENLGKGKIESAVKNVLPSSVRGAEQGLTALTEGKFVDKNGRTITTATTGEAIVRLLGFQPANLAETYRSIERMEVEAQNVQYLKSNIYNLLAEAIVEKDVTKRMVAMRMFNSYNQKNPTATLILNDGVVTRKVNDMRMSLADRYKQGLPRELRGEYDSIFSK